MAHAFGQAGAQGRAQVQTRASAWAEDRRVGDYGGDRKSDPAGEIWRNAGKGDGGRGVDF